MNLRPTDEQVLLRDTAFRLLAEIHPFERRRRTVASADGFDAALWRVFAEQGWLALPFSEETGGLRGGAVEVAILAEALGRAAVVEPYVPVVVLAGGLIEALGTAEQRAALLPPLIAGTSLPALAAFDPRSGRYDRTMTIAEPRGDGFVLSGEKALVPFGHKADVILVTAQVTGEAGLGVFLVPADATGLERTDGRTVDGGRASDLRLDGVAVPADARLGGRVDARPALDAVFARAVTAATADALGAMTALLDATLSHAKTREQFGKPLAAFQALQHRMAEMAVKVEEARASALLAAIEAEAPEPYRTRGVSGAKAKIGRLSRAVAQEAIQLHGAMGFSEELPVGTWFKRLYAFENRWGSTAEHLARYAEAAVRPELREGGLLRPGTSGRAQNLDLDAEDLAFRDQVRGFLTEALTPDLVRAERLNPSFLAHPDAGRPWQARLAGKGWAAPSWPGEHGGPGWSLARRYLFDQECERAGEPRFRGAGLKMIGPVLIRHGTAEQKSRYLPRILSGEDLWAQGYSEPGAGSDLASLKTRAVRDGDHYVVDGTKIWSTLAHHATRMFALVRTADTGRKQEGITFLLIDLSAPGVTIRPIVSICGTHEFNQVFFDGVRVPVADRVGAEGEGWEIAKDLLEHERGGSFAGGMLRALLARLLRIAEAPGPDGLRPIDDPLVRARLAEIGTDVDANDMMELTALSAVAAGGAPGPVPSSTMKIERSRIRQAITELAAAILGPDALRWEERRPLHHLPERPAIEEEKAVAPTTYLNARSQSLFGGTNEIQLEIIARTLLR